VTERIRARFSANRDKLITELASSLIDACARHVEKGTAMSIQSRRILGDPLPQGTGFSPDSPSQVDPVTGATNESYTAEPPSARQSTAYGLDSDLSRGRGSEADFRRAQAASSGVRDGGGPGFALSHDSDDAFETTGRVGDDTGTGYGIAGDDGPLVTRSAGADRGEGGYGKAIG
jgi:hypothetical protein